MTKVVEGTASVRIYKFVRAALGSVVQPKSRITILQHPFFVLVSITFTDHLIISFRPSSQMKVPPPRGSMSLKSSTQRRDWSEESKKCVNQLPSLRYELMSTDYSFPEDTDTCQFPRSLGWITFCIFVNNAWMMDLTKFTDIAIFLLSEIPNQTVSSLVEEHFVNSILSTNNLTYIK